MLLFSCLRYQQRRVAIAQETEIVCQSIIIYLMPVAFHEGTHQKKQCGLRLMEIGDEHLDNLIIIARGNDDHDVKCKVHILYNEILLNL